MKQMLIRGRKWKDLCRILALACVFALCSISAVAQIEKPEAALSGISILGEISETDERILFNQLQSQLSSSYRLISREVFEQAQLKMYQEIEANCTEDRCIRRIQDILQVDRLFSLMMLRSGNLTQLSLTLAKGDEKIVKADSCTGCDVSRLLEQIKTLAEQVANEDPEALAVAGMGTHGFVLPTPPVAGITAKIERITPTVSGDRQSNIAFLFFDSVPTGADVYLGDTRAGTTPFQALRLQPGQRIVVTIRHSDYRERLLGLTLSGGINKLDPVRLQSKYGRLTITSQPSGAEIFLAGKQIGKTPYSNNRVLSGAYLATLEYPLYQSIENQKIVIEDEKTTTRHFTLLANYGELKVRTEPSVVSIQVFDKENKQVATDTSPATIKLTPGEYNVRLSKAGYEPLEYTIGIAKDSIQEIVSRDATLRRWEGYLVVSSDPFKEDAVILINGEKQGRVPGEFTLPAGTHTVQVETEFQVGSREVSIKDGATESLTISLFDKMSAAELEEARGTWKLKLGLSAGASVVCAVLMYMEYQKAQTALSSYESEEEATLKAASYEEAQQHSDQADSYKSEIEEANSKATLYSYLTISLAGLATWFWFDEPKDPREYSLEPLFKSQGKIGMNFRYAWR